MGEVNPAVGNVGAPKGQNRHPTPIRTQLYSQWYSGPNGESRNDISTDEFRIIANTLGAEAARQGNSLQARILRFIGQNIRRVDFLDGRIDGHISTWHIGRIAELGNIPGVSTQDIDLTDLLELPNLPNPQQKKQPPPPLKGGNKLGDANANKAINISPGDLAKLPVVGHISYVNGRKTINIAAHAEVIPEPPRQVFDPSTGKMVTIKPAHAEVAPGPPEQIFDPRTGKMVTIKPAAAYTVPGDGTVVKKDGRYYEVSYSGKNISLIPIDY